MHGPTGAKLWVLPEPVSGFGEQLQICPCCFRRTKSFFKRPWKCVGCGCDVEYIGPPGRRPRGSQRAHHAALAAVLSLRAASSSGERQGCCESCGRRLRIRRGAGRPARFCGQTCRKAGNREAHVESGRLLTTVTHRLGSLDADDVTALCAFAGLIDWRMLQGEAEEEFVMLDEPYRFGLRLSPPSVLAVIEANVDELARILRTALPRNS